MFSLRLEVPAIGEDSQSARVMARVGVYGRGMQVGGGPTVTGSKKAKKNLANSDPKCAAEMKTHASSLLATNLASSLPLESFAGSDPK
jgi:hypothetical protein